MENVILLPVQQEFHDFMKMEPGVPKNIAYYRQIMGRTFTEANICKKDGCIYYSCTDMSFKKSKNSFYVQRKNRNGFTVDKKGKINVWFGKNIYEIPHVDKVFQYFNFNWITNSKIYPYITKGILEKMIAGKITNSTEIVKEYFKKMHINASPSLFIKFLDKCDSSKVEILRVAGVAKDLNHYFEDNIKLRTATMSNPYPQDSYTRNQLLNDMIQEAQILGKKIDYTWSLNRLKEVHKEWTEEIMKIEIESLDDVSVNGIDYFDKFTPEGFKLLKTQKEVFTEGSLMKHCVYTAYWNTIKNGNYLAYHVNYKGEEATLGINIYNDRVVFNQCYSRYNQSVSDELRLHVMMFIDNLNHELKKENYFLNKKEQHVEFI